ncbi:MAG: GAF domain-containing protein [Dissulfurispiraceae bacterium]
MLAEKKLSILQEISNVVVAADNTGTIANVILDLAVSNTNAEKGSLMLIDHNGDLYIYAAKGVDLSLVESYRIKVGEGIAGTVAATRLPVMVKDIEKDTRFIETRRDRYKTRSFISCPLVSKKSLFGVININDKRDGLPFEEDEFDLVKIIASQAAVLLENVDLMNQILSKVAELEELNRKLAEAEMLKADFLTRISHELRTPLNSIKGSIYYLQKAEKVSKGEKAEFYSIIADETSKLISTVETQLDFFATHTGGERDKKSSPEAYKISIKSSNRAIAEE